MRVLRAGVLGLVAAAVLGGAADAHACSLPAEEPRDVVRRADKAVYGEIVSATTVRRSTETAGARIRYRLRVVRRFKGRLPRVIELVGHTDEAACGVGRLRVGRRYGFVLHGRRGPYRVDLGSLMSLRDLRRATGR